MKFKCWNCGFYEEEDLFIMERYLSKPLLEQRLRCPKCQKIVNIKRKGKKDV